MTGREGQSPGEDVPRGVVARRPRRRCRRAGDQLLRGHGDDAARVAGHRGRRTSSSGSRPGPSRTTSSSRSASSTSRCCSLGIFVVLGLRLRVGRPAAPDGPGGRRRRLRRPDADRGGRGARTSAAPPRRLVPVAVGFVTWLVALSLLTEPLHLRAGRSSDAPRRRGRRPSRCRRRDHTRRGFVIRAGIFAVGAAVSRRRPGRGSGPPARGGVPPAAPARPSHRARVPRRPGRASKGSRRGRRRTDLLPIDTALVVPAIEPKDWSLRIHGMVDREITLTTRTCSTASSPRTGSPSAACRTTWAAT